MIKDEIKQINEDRDVTIGDIATIVGVTRQAVYRAVKENKLPASRKSGKWMVKISDFERYLNDKYSRDNLHFNGVRVFDPKNGIYSITHVSRDLKISNQVLYYNIRIGRLKSERRGRTIVLKSEDVRKWLEEFGLKDKVVISVKS